MKSFKDNKGFTLVEMAVVVVILGLMAALILPGIFKTIERNRLEKGRAAVTALKNEVIGFVVTQSGSAKSLPNFTQFNSLAGRVDQWGQDVIYWHAENGTTNICPPSPPTGLQLTKHVSPTNSTVLDHVAFVLVSTGQNMNPDSECTGGTCPNSGAVQEVDVYWPGRVDSGFEFDDIVEYVGLSELIGKACP